MPGLAQDKMHGIRETAAPFSTAPRRCAEPARVVEAK